jgi:hypothetical protein
VTRRAAWLLWLALGSVLMLLGLRFAMRAVGVRPDVTLPGLVYSITEPLVAPFYRFFPPADRYDYPVMEPASLAATGCVMACGLLVYVVALLLGLGRRG